MKKIFYYYMPFCPRSYLGLKNLNNAVKEYQDIQIIVKKVFYLKIDSKLYFPPLIKSGDKILYGFYLSRNKINNFFR